MTRLHADQLPPAVRKRHGLDPKPTSTRPSRAGVSDHQPCPGHCGDCGQPFPTAAAWQDHADRHGHHRWNITLETP